MPVSLRLINDNGVEQTLAAHSLDERALEILKTFTEEVAEFLSPLNHLLLLHDLKSTHGYRTSERVAAVGRTVGTGLNGEHDVFAAQHTRDRVHTTRDGLAQEDQIGLDSTPLVAEELAGAGNTRLDLVTDQEYIVLVAQCASLLQVVLVGDDNTGFTLDGLDQESGQAGTGLLKGLAQSSLVVVQDRLIGPGNGAANVRQVRAVVLTRLRVGG